MDNAADGRILPTLPEQMTRPTPSWSSTARCPLDIPDVTVLTSDASHLADISLTDLEEPFNFTMTVRTGLTTQLRAVPSHEERRLLGVTAPPARDAPAPARRVTPAPPAAPAPAPTPPAPPRPATRWGETPTARHTPASTERHPRTPSRRQQPHRPPTCPDPGSPRRASHAPAAPLPETPAGPGPAAETTDEEPLRWPNV